MISSEVQRTLVKSPPELWAEISDPDSLARHLGELGEIRITRSKPEELVEWQSERASGTISIKASGWGTRVTLTAARELPLALDTETAADGREATVGVGQDAQGVQDEPEGQAAEGVEAEARPEGQAGEAVEAEAEPEGQAVPLVTEPQLGAPAEPEAEPGEVAETVEPEPAITAAAAEPSVPPVTPAGAMSAWARHEADSPQEQALPETPGEQATLSATSEAPTETQHTALPEMSEPSEAEAQDAEPADQPEMAEPARRGFFARLFRRRSRPKPAPASAGGQAPEIELHIAREAARRRLEATLTMAEAALTPPAAADEQASPAPAEAPPEPEMSVPLAPEVETEAAADQAETPGPQAPEAPETAVGEPLQDLAAELREAEETAAEEVRAVLTAVLDRLGAAHHRPFSRG